MDLQDRYSSLSRAAQVARIRALGVNALRQFNVEPISMKLLVHAENTTFRVNSPQGEYCLRVQRPGYQTIESTASELAFLEHLRSRGLPVPEPVHAPDERTIVSASGPSLDGPRNCELFRWMIGRFYRRSYGPTHTFQVGRLMAKLHLAALEFGPPKGFERRLLDQSGLFRPEADTFLAGESPLMTPERCRRLTRLIEKERPVMEQLGRGRDVYGLIHADLHHGNVVWTGGQPQAIDFDDTGWGHYLYDFAAALAFGLGAPAFAEKRDAMFAGYEAIAPLPPHTRELLPTFIRLRYFELVRWVVARQDNPYFRQHGDTIITRWLNRLDLL